jgi:hypothetical protein
MVHMVLAVGAGLHWAATAQQWVGAAQNLAAAAQHLAAEVGMAQQELVASPSLVGGSFLLFARHLRRLGDGAATAAGFRIE